MSLLMEGETKKRKITNIIYEEEEEDEDLKMEKFFALIRSAKDIRDQLLEAEGPSKARAKKAVATEKKAEAVRVLQKNKEKSFTTAAADADADADAAIVSNRAAVVSNVAFEIINNEASIASNGPAIVSTRADAIVNNQVAAASSAAAAAGRSNRSPAEEMSKEAADQKKVFKGGRIILDLNLSL